MKSPHELLSLYHSALIGELAHLADPACRISRPLAVHLAGITARRAVRIGAVLSIMENTALPFPEMFRPPVAASLVDGLSYLASIGLDH